MVSAGYDWNMSLTSSDLNQIKEIVETSALATENRVIKRIDELDDSLSMQMEHGLQEIRDTVNRIEKVQMKEVIRAENHELAINHIRNTLHSA